jgi:NADH:ubiquinone oxidoreductase subunit 5 (subunit L)/multisubunit Na+/H+ antiporter MnhA subunit
LPILVILFGALFALLGHPGVFDKNLTTGRLSTISVLYPLAAFIWLISHLPLLGSGQAISWQINWILATDLQVSFYYDSLSAIFGLLVTGIGVVVVFYSGFYFRDNPQG